MAQTIRFHLDENCHRAIAEGLRRRGIDVSTTPEAKLTSASDEQHLAFASPLGRVIFTQDRDFLRLHAAGVPHAGIVYCDKGTRSIGEIVSMLALIYQIYEPGELEN
ncbi:MAG: DUF5615 family PIN-like protein, partial [Beijerinckiaceae bacterium]|nr:DUF5615 family PIN-like protein [Beijerinckiaceae bacterium]